MGYRLGIDLGATSTIAVVVGDSGDAAPVALGHHGPAAPSAVLVDANGAIRCGDEAIAAAADLPDRLVRRFTPRIGDEIPMTVGPADGEHLRLHPQDIAAALVSWVLATVTEAQGGAPQGVALAHPSNWGGHKLQLMERALTVRDLGYVRLISAAQAAGRTHPRLLDPAAGDAFAVWDMGGESVSAAVLRVDPEGNVWPLGRPEHRADLGGADFDDAVLNHVLEALPAGAADSLLAISPAGSALDELRAASRAAKEQLSAATDAIVEVAVAGRRIRIRITRAEFEARIAADARRGLDLLAEAISGAGLRSGDLRGIVLCGGSSAVPLITHQLSARFPAVPVVREADPTLTVACGAALSLAPAAAPAARPTPGPATPTRPALEVASIVGRGPSQPDKPTSGEAGQAPPAARWGRIRLVPAHKPADVAGAEPPVAAPPRTAPAPIAAALPVATPPRTAPAPVPAAPTQLPEPAAAPAPVARPMPAQATTAPDVPASQRVVTEALEMPIPPTPRTPSAPPVVDPTPPVDDHPVTPTAPNLPATPATGPAVEPIRRPTTNGGRPLPARRSARTAPGHLQTPLVGAAAPGAPAARSVIGPRAVGHLADLLAVPVGRHSASPASEAKLAAPAQAASAAQSEQSLTDIAVADEDLIAQFETEFESEFAAESETEFEAEFEAEDEDEDDEEYQPQELWRRGLAMCTPRRVLAVTAITGALFVGSSGWLPAVPAITATQSAVVTPPTAAHPTPAQPVHRALRSSH